MLVNFEKRYFENEIKVWKRTYTDLQNMIHWHKEYELIFIEKGSAEICVNKNCFIANAGDLVICKGGDMHRINSVEKGTVCDVIIFDDVFLRAVTQGISLAYPHVNAKTISDKKLNAKKLFDLVSKELKEKNIYANEMITSHFMVFFVKCIRSLKYISDSQERKNHKQAFTDSYQKLLQYINYNYADVNFENSARLLNYTPQHFSKIFKEVSGMTFTDYLNQVRIEKAVSLIQTSDLTVVAVAEKCGFNNIRSFNRIFKKITGKTPTEINYDYKLSDNLQQFEKNHDSFIATISYTSAK